MVQSAAHPPSVDVRAFHGHGGLAFISRGQLWVLDGQGRTVRQLSVPAGYEPASLAFFHDGRWLAYRVTRPGDPYGPSELWISDAAGTGAHHVVGLTVNQLVGWSPRADRLAVAAGESSAALPTALDVISPNGQTRILIHRSARQPTAEGAIWSATWSPAGTSLAVSTDSPTWGSGTRCRTQSGGRHTLRWHRDGLWLADRATGKPLRSSIRSTASTWSRVRSTDLSFYGHVPWPAQFSWFSQ